MITIQAQATSQEAADAERKIQMQNSSYSKTTF